MRIRVSDIPYSGLKVADSLSLEALNARMQEGQGSDIIFTSAPKVNLTIFKTDSGAECKGKVISSYTQACSLCLKELPKPLELDANFIFKRINTKPSEDDLPEDEIGINYFAGDHIELEDMIQESLILSLSLYWHPPTDSSGNCSECKLAFFSKKEVVKPVSTNSLGDFLAKAKKK